MGNSASKAKIHGVSLGKIGRLGTAGFPSSTASSSERTMVEELNQINHKSIDSKSEKKKPSILPGGSFFKSRAHRAKETKITNKKLAPSHQNYDHTSVKKTTASRKKPKTKKKTHVTKSIIGKPTNFKHLSSSSSFNGHDINAVSAEEDAMLASQMITLATMIKPLPNAFSGTSKLSRFPIIPPRTSSYHNEDYLKSYSVPSPLLRASSVSRKNKRSAAIPSIKKTRKNQVKYVSIGKTSMARKPVHHNKMPRESSIA